MRTYFIVEQKMSSGSVWCDYYKDRYSTLEEAAYWVRFDKIRHPKGEYRVCKVTQEVVQP